MTGASNDGVNGVFAGRPIAEENWLLRPGGRRIAKKEPVNLSGTLLIGNYTAAKKTMRNKGFR
ncbi:MAG: hypothetical protein KGM47_10780, partial [Acidobacteriota bacterium]|nr:hypothetical protein [Acidobacteriota bacterium]